MLHNTRELISEALNWKFRDFPCPSFTSIGWIWKLFSGIPSGRNTSWIHNWVFILCDHIVLFVKRPLKRSDWGIYKYSVIFSRADDIWRGGHSVVPHAGVSFTQGNIHTPTVTLQSHVHVYAIPLLCISRSPSTPLSLSPSVSFFCTFPPLSSLSLFLSA